MSRRLALLSMFVFFATAYATLDRIPQRVLTSLRASEVTLQVAVSEPLSAADA